MTTKTNHPFVRRPRPTQQLVMLPNTYLRRCFNVNCDVVLYDATMTERCWGFDDVKGGTCNDVGTPFGKRWEE